LVVKAILIIYDDGLTEKEHTMDPLVSIIIPAFNAEKYIKETIDSVFDQTFQDFEIIVVDDGSTDNTREILNQYGKRIRCIYQENSGPSKARNTAIKAAHGEHIAFLDADDLWKSDFLERTVHIMQGHSELGYVFTEFDLFSKDGVITRHQIKDDGRVAQIPVGWQSGDEKIFARSIWSDLATGCFIPTSGILIRRIALEKVGLFDEGLTHAEDRDLFIRLAREYDVGFIDECLSHKRQHPLGIGQDLEKVVIGSDVVIRRLLARNDVDATLRRTIKKRLGKQWYLLGRSYLGKNNAKSARDSFKKSFPLYPAIHSLCFFIFSVTGLFRPLRALKKYIIRK